MKHTTTFAKTTLCTLFLMLGACQNQISDQAKVASPEMDTSAPVTFADHSEATRADFMRCGVDEDEYSRLMALSKKDFDQDFQGGWREVAYRDDCHAAAAQLLISYLELHDIKPHSGSNVIYWHVGQMFAQDDQTQPAIKYFKLAYDKDAENKTHEKEWALYAEGTIAYMNRDLDALKAARDELATYEVSEERKAAIKKMLGENPKMSFPKGFPEKPLNVIALESLIRCFDQPYSKAYGKCDK